MREFLEYLDSIINTVIYGGNYWLYLLLYFYSFAILELLTHEGTHYLCLKYFKIRIDLFRIGLLKIYSRKTQNTLFIVGLLPIAGACGEPTPKDINDAYEDPTSFDYKHRPPYQRLIAAGSAPMFALLLGLAGLWTNFQLSSHGITVHPFLPFCFIIIVINEAFNLLVPIKCGKYKTDAWIVYESSLYYLKRVFMANTPR